MSISTASLIKQHEEIGDLIEAAGKAMPFQKMVIAAKAAEKSHALMGDLLAKLESMEAANDGH